MFSLSYVQILKVGVPDLGYKTFAPRGEAPGFEFLTSVSDNAGDGVYGKIVSQPFLPALMWFSSLICPMWRGCSISFLFFPEEIVAYIAIDLKRSGEEMSSGSSYIAILNQNPLCFQF